LILITNEIELKVELVGEFNKSYFLARFEAVVLFVVVDRVEVVAFFLLFFEVEGFSSSFGCSSVLTPLSSCEADAFCFAVVSFCASFCLFSSFFSSSETFCFFASFS
jgi:hypothetical protein